MLFALDLIREGIAYWSFSCFPIGWLHGRSLITWFGGTLVKRAKVECVNISVCSLRNEGQK